jgi:hypothetical protein
MPKAPNWSTEEIEYLFEIANTDAFYAIVKIFQRKAKKEGWYHRGEDAIKIKMMRLKISIRPLDGGWNCTGLAEMLGIDRDRVHSWIGRGLLKSTRKVGKRHHRIDQKDFVDFADTYPNWLTDIEETNLKLLLPDPIVENIIAQPIRTRGVSLPVQTNKGTVYPSIRAAARGEHYCRTHIKHLAETNGRTLDGVAFQAS